MQRAVQFRGQYHKTSHDHHQQRVYVARRQPLHHRVQQHHEGWCRSPLHTTPLLGVHHQETHPARDLVQVDAATADAGEAASGSGGIGTVMSSVLSAAMGAFSFGYALSVVNGPLDAIAVDLGFAGDAALQGMVCVGADTTFSYTS